MKLQALDKDESLYRYAIRGEKYREKERDREREWKRESKSER